MTSPGAEAALRPACPQSPEHLPRSALVVPPSCRLTLLTYALVVAAIARMPSAAGRHKAFSACAAHLALVSVHRGRAAISCLRPDSGPSGAGPPGGRALQGSDSAAEPRGVHAAQRGRRAAPGRTLARCCGDSR